MAFPWTQNHQKSAKSWGARCPVRVGNLICADLGIRANWAPGEIRYLKTSSSLDTLKVPYVRVKTVACLLYAANFHQKIQKYTPTSRLRCVSAIHFLSPISHTISPDRSSGKDRGYAIRAIRHWMQVRFVPILAPKKALRSLTYCSQVVPTLIDNWWYNICNLKLSPPCVLCVFFFQLNYLGPAGDIQINI